MSNPLQVLTLDQLRSRTSDKWRRYPEDVLPLRVAEMQVALAEPIIEAVSAAMASGDTGYCDPNSYAEAMAEFASKRWGWTFDDASSALLPNVMLGIVEVLKLVTRPGDKVVVNSPVYTPFYQFVGTWTAESASHRWTPYTASTSPILNTRSPGIGRLRTSCAVRTTPLAPRPCTRTKS